MIVLKSKLCFTSVLSKKLQRRFDENELKNIKCTETISQIMLSTLKITLIFLFYFLMFLIFPERFSLL